jgi:iron complex outermembrane receptor protein
MKKYLRLTTAYGGAHFSAGLAAAVLVSLAVMPQALAQQMDYGSLQDLFGGPVTTSATGTPQRASDVAADMTIITADQIKHAGTRSLPQIIGMYVAGIDVSSPGNGAFDVGVRGYQ